MFRRTPTEKTKLEEAIDDLLGEMVAVSGDSDDYSKMCYQLTELYKLKEIDAPQRISPDTLIIVAGNLLGIILIVSYEKTNIVASRALNLLLKTR